MGTGYWILSNSPEVLKLRADECWPEEAGRAAFLPLKMLSAKEIELQVTEIEKEKEEARKKIKEVNLVLHMSIFKSVRFEVVFTHRLM